MEQHSHAMEPEIKKGLRKASKCCLAMNYKKHICIAINNNIDNTTLRLFGWFQWCILSHGGLLRSNA